MLGTISVLVAVLMVSTATAVPLTQSTPFIEQKEKIEYLVNELNIKLGSAVYDFPFLKLLLLLIYVILALPFAVLGLLIKTVSWIIENIRDHTLLNWIRTLINLLLEALRMLFGDALSSP